MIPAFSFLGALPWRRIGIGLGGALLVWGAVNWHGRQINAVRTAAMQEQAALDAADFEAARQAAEQQQKDEIEAQRRRSAALNKDAVNDLQVRNDRLGADYAALRLRWKQAQAQIASGGTGQGGTTAVSADAGRDPFSAARAAGWVDFETAATLAEAADRATLSAQAKADWWLQQCRAWPGPKPEDCL